jgi:hypothetical protein
MKTMLIVTAIGIVGFTAFAARTAESAGTSSETAPAVTSLAAIAESDEISVGDRYLVPALPASVVDQLPAAERAGDRYLAERLELAELVIGDRTLAAEDRATTYAHDLPGFSDVLLADGFRPDTNGVWYYDRFESWMRFPLNR